MYRGMGGALPTEKLDRSNYVSWEYNMHQYLLGHDYRSYIHGENEVAQEPTHKDFLVWEHIVNRVLHFLVVGIKGRLLLCILSMNTSK